MKKILKPNVNIEKICVLFSTKQHDSEESEVT